MSFSTEFIDSLKKRISITETVSRFVAVQRRGTRLVGLCPFHKEKTPSFYIFEQEDSYYCFGCKAHGDIFDFVMAIRGFDFPAAIEHLASEAGVALPQDSGDRNDAVSLERKVFYEIMETACVFYEQHLKSNAGHKTRRYLNERGIPTEWITKFRLGYAPSGNSLRKFLLDKGYSLEQLLNLQLTTRTGDYDFFRNRLIFPIVDKQKKVIAFGGRSLDGSDPKYLNTGDTPIFQKGHHLYGYAQSRECPDRDRPAIICEGYLDVIALHQAGFGKAVAPLGTSIGELQIELAWRLNPTPIICFDGDLAGKKASLAALGRALPILRPGHSLQFVTLPHGEDPDSLVRQGRIEILQKLFSQPQPLATKFWESLIQEVPTETPEQQAFFKQNLLKKLEAIKNFEVKKAYQDMLLSQYYRLIRNTQRGQKTEKGTRSLKSSQRQGVSAVRIRHRILLALPLYQPAILEEIHEAFLGFDFQDTQFNALKESMISYINDNKVLDINAFHTHLKQEGYKDLLKDLLAEELRVHEKCLDFYGIMQDAMNQWFFYYNKFVDQVIEEEERMRRYKQVRQELNTN